MSRHWKPSGKPCSVQGCTRPHKAYSYCQNHLRSWQLCGDPLRHVRVPKKPTPPPPPPRTLAGLLAEHTVADDECQLWTGPRAHGGYGHGVITLHGTAEPVHRAVWRSLWGEPPARVYRRCQRPNCVAPEHLTDRRQTDPWVPYRLTEQPIPWTARRAASAS